jgi:LysR family hydrogen peroxide-inducible transcriptional activator
VWQLECAVAVAEHLSFRRAAEACHITQPALSAQIQHLEAALGLRLFERDHHRVALTPAGEELLARARALLVAIDDMVGAVGILKEPLSGTLRLGVIPTVAPYVLPRALPAVRKLYPRLRLFLREERTSALVQRARDGELDLLLLALEADLGALKTLPLYRDPFVLAVSAQHSLARKRSVREADLADEEVLLLEDGHCLRSQALAICARAGAGEFADFRASSLNTLVQMVSSGIGLTLLPAMCAGSEVHARDRLALVPFAERAPGRTITLAWRKSSAREADFERLAEALVEHAPDGVVPMQRWKHVAG